MTMKKKITIKEVSSSLPEPTLADALVEEALKDEKPMKIVPIVINLGREDLNQLVSKMNEIINHINNQ